MEDFRGRTAVITGSASGIGFALARRLGRAGANIALVDVEDDALQTAAERLRGEGITVLACRTDVREEGEVQQLADVVMDTFGAVHVLVNNAGVDAGGWFGDISREAWSWVMDVNFYGVLHGCRVFLPLLSVQDEAYIVNTASVAAFATGAPTLTPYCVSKFAVLALTECLDIELRQKDSPVGVSLLVPGPTRTRMTSSERNRPDGVPATNPRSVRAQLSARAAEYVEREGMDPAETAEHVVSAMRERRFFILTHPEQALEGMERRMRWMVDNVAPAPRTL